MLVVEKSNPIIVDGVRELHQQINSAFETAVSIASRTGVISLDDAKNQLKEKHFEIVVNTNEKQPENGLKGYFIFKNMICRFLDITFDYALLFPIRDHSFCDVNYFLEGITYNEIQELIRNRSSFILRFMRFKEIGLCSNRPIPINFTLFRVALEVTTLSDGTFDEVGNPYYEFPDIDKLNLVDIPEKLHHEYTLVGKNFYAPFTTNNTCNCVLFAQLDNQYDDSAIKVLRWLPAKKSDEIDQLLSLESERGNHFFEMGYISKQENSDLHSFMVEQNSRLLFGIKNGNRISIDGGIKIFQTSDLKYPVCLYNIKLG